MITTTTKTPFEVLGVSTDANSTTIAAAYNSLLWRYHPDVSALEEPEATRRTSELNWARRELNENLEGWRKTALRLKWLPRFTVWDSNDRVDKALSQRLIEITPHALTLEAKVGSTAIITARADGADPNAIRVRFAQEGRLEVRRLPSDGDRAVFLVRVVREATATEPARPTETLDVVCEGYSTRSLSVLLTASPLFSPRAATPKGKEERADQWFLNRLANLAPSRA